MPESVYIHIPFCKSKCKYCSFVSFNKPELVTGYMYSLLKEITDNYCGEDIKTLYFGGGTPSIILFEFIKKIIKKFNLSSNCEVTFEFNPDDNDIDYLKNLRDIGVNRLSIGSQTFNDNILKLIGRRHNSQQITETVLNAKKVGFGNISLDLIYGLPNQTIDILKKDIENILMLDIQHISTYGLKIEENSYFGKNPPVNVPDDDTQADMYLMINDLLKNNGFNRYEISNFSKKGFVSKHNLTYWNNSEYYGFGVSAHGYVNGIRYSNYETLEKYMDNPTCHEFGKTLTKQEQLEEEIFLGLRKSEGIDIKNINSKFGIDFCKKYEKILDNYKDYFEIKNDKCAFNINGVLLSNIILSEFLD